MCENRGVVRRGFILGSAVIAALPGTARAEESAEDSRARWLAGMPSGTPATADWQVYAASEDDRWQRSIEARVKPMHDFGAREIQPLLPADHAVVYPFAGPDALHVLSLFGAARRYLLVGLEPVGKLVDPRAVPPGYFARLGAATSDVHRLSFFRTQEMASDFERDGVIAALLATIARMNGKVSSVQTAATTVRVEWTVAGAARRLDYIQSDLSNGGLQSNGQLSASLQALAPHVTFVKAAMFLLAEARFSTLRKMLLQGSSLLLQDDTGIPLRHLDASWSTRLFGRYEAPGAPFEERFQPDLRAAYERRAATPLAFGIGYHVEAKRSNLLLASRVR